MSTIVIEHFRVLELPDRTIGNVNIPGVGVIYTLEDATRPYGQKIYGETAIPFNDSGYKVGKVFSSKFHRNMINLYTEEDGLTLQHGGIKFTNIYLHSGNTPKDTLGCILIAYNYVNTGKKIYGSSEKDTYEAISDLLDEGKNIVWKISKSTKWL